ncbi:MAG: ABC transporter substrate-binding protein [Nitrospirales bacterium]
MIPQFLISSVRKSPRFIIIIHWPATLLILALGLVFGACSSQPDPNTIRMGVAQAPTNLDPRYATDATSARINRLLYSRLVDFEQDATPVPSLATWVQQSPTHYVFTLRDHVPEFHNGQGVTSQDIKATYESILSPHNASPHRGVLHIIDRMETPSDTEISFYLKRTDPFFPSYLVIGILPANLIANRHPFSDHPIGNGPFRFLDRPDETRVRLVRQTDGQLVEFLRIPDPTVRVLKLLAGEIQLLQNDLPPELVAYLANQPTLHLQQSRGANFAYLGFNHQDPLTGNILVRQAIAHAINREDIIRYVFQNRARQAQALFPPDHWAGPVQLTGYPYDPDRARTLLAEAGFGISHRPTLIYKTSTDPFRLRLATIIQDQLSRVGIDVVIQSHDWGTFYGDIKTGRFQMYSLAWVGVKTPDIFRHAFHSQSIPPTGANRGRFASPIADHLIEQAEVSTNRTEQRTLYHDLQVHFLETLPYIPLWFEDHICFSSTEITGYRLESDGNFDGLLQVQRNTSTTHVASIRSPAI